MTDNVLVEVENLRKAFGGLIAVYDVSMQVKVHSMHAIIGPNGAGKTTLFNLISGVMQPTNGKVSLRGRISPMCPHRNVHTWV